MLLCETSCYVRTERPVYGQTDMTKLIVAYKSFVKAPKSKTLNGCVLGYF